MVFRRLAAGAVAWLLPLAAAAEATIYRGELIPGNYDAPISLTIALEDESGTVSGEGMAGPPVSGAVTFRGARFGGACTITVHFQRQYMARLEGSCSSQRFEGHYKMYDDKQRRTLGMFRLDAEKPAKKSEEDASSTEATLTPQVRPSPTYCLKKKVACLSACPRGDYNAEFLCANTCRRKELGCLGKGSGGRAWMPTTPSYLPSVPQELLPAPDKQPETKDQPTQ